MFLFNEKIFIFNEKYFHSILLFLCSVKKNTHTHTHTQEHYFKERIVKNLIADIFHLLLVCN